RPAAPAATTPRTTTATPTGAGQFPTEAQAKARCPSDTVVWVNLDSKVYHFAGTRNYGTTKSGAYMCERDATAAGSRAAKNEKRPGWWVRKLFLRAARVTPGGLFISKQPPARRFRKSRGRTALCHFSRK